MTDESIAFQQIDWKNIPKVEHPGELGTALWQTQEFHGFRMRMVEYSSGYLADHWCRKGHIVHCLEGEFLSELDDGRKIVLSAGMSYVVSDDAMPHRSRSANGVTLLIIDGDFLRRG